MKNNSAHNHEPKVSTLTHGSGSLILWGYFPLARITNIVKSVYKDKKKELKKYKQVWKKTC